MFPPYQGAPGYARPPPGYAATPPGYAATPPGMGPPRMASFYTGPPGISNTSNAPGLAPPPVHAQPPTLGGPRPLPPNWQTSVNMPNINFNAPVIRLGTAGPPRGAALDGLSGRRESGAPGRRGLGMDGPSRDGDGQRIQQLIQPTREEIARTIFVGSIPQGVGGDEGMERILATAGNLVRWTRATDANNKPQTFGFAEYEDAQSLETAAEIFKDVQVPIKRQEPGPKPKGDDGGVEGVEKTKLQVVVDDASIKYAAEWKGRRGDDERTTQFRIDTAREHLTQILASLFNPPVPLPIDHAGDMGMQDINMGDADDVEIVNIAFSAEDELADIPADMREVVAAEIAAFRDRSNRRDQERLKREEEIEAEERRRAGRRASPPASAPTGPGGANGVPLGPRADRGIHGAPSGPKGSHFPRDYQGGVSFVNGGAINNGVYIRREDDDDSASDEEIERRRKKKQDEEADELYRKKLSQWLKHEGRNATSLERTSDRMKNEESEKQRARESQAKYLANFDDDVEASKRSILFYRDHGEYMRDREKIRDREAREDAVDRAQEQRELAARQKQKEVARGMADAFLEETGEEISRAASQAQPFKLSLGAATKKMEEAAAPRRTVADVENLLEDEEVADAPISKKRTLIPINFDASVRANLTAEEAVEAQQQLAREIPSDKEGLWGWKISWEHLPEKAIDTDIKNWAEKKILDIMGIQEDLLVDAIVDHLRTRGEPQELVENLEVALDDEAGGLVKKLWRMVIYYSEQEKRGIK